MYLVVVVLINSSNFFLSLKTNTVLLRFAKQTTTWRETKWNKVIFFLNSEVHYNSFASGWDATTTTYHVGDLDGVWRIDGFWIEVKEVRSATTIADAVEERRSRKSTVDWKADDQHITGISILQTTTSGNGNQRRRLSDQRGSSSIFAPYSIEPSTCYCSFYSIRNMSFQTRLLLTRMTFNRRRRCLWCRWCRQWDKLGGVRRHRRCVTNQGSAHAGLSYGSLIYSRYIRKTLQVLGLKPMSWKWPEPGRCLLACTDIAVPSFTHTPQNVIFLAFHSSRYCTYRNRGRAASVSRKLW